MDKWLPVKGYEGFYEISDRGFVRSTTCGGPTGSWKRKSVRPVLVKPNIYGYHRVGLCKPGAKRKCFNVHRLVLECFIGPPPRGTECNHKDGDKSNNSVSNLEWVTRKENATHKARLGLAAKGDGHGMRIHKGLVAGERNGRSVLSEDEVYDIRARYARGESIIKMAIEHGCSEAAMYSAATGRSWKHLKGAKS